MPRSPADHHSDLLGKTPFEIALRWNSQIQAAHSTIASEMQDFLARRLNEDFALLRRVSQCRTPHELVAAYTDFWRKAAEDYGKEATTVAKLMINATSKMAVAGEPDMDQQKTVPVAWREAAE